MNQIICIFWFEMCTWDVAAHFLRVTSEADCSDGLSRDEFATVQALQAEEVEPILPEWLGDIWNVPQINAF